MTSANLIVNHSWNDGKQIIQCEDLELSEAARKIARKELREDDKMREQSIEQMRAWIKKNRDIENVSLEDRFILRFLRIKKFSVPMAQQTLLKYLNLRKHFPMMTTNLDFLSPPINELISTGYIFVSPVRDRKGRRVVIANAKNFNPHRHCSADMAKAHILTYESLLTEPENQVMGVTHVGDVKGISAAHITCWNPNEYARILKWGEQSMPMRFKEIHLTNVPPALKWVLDFAKTRLSTKIKNRFHIHGDQVQLHKNVDPMCLPKELGGQMPQAEMIELWKREVATKRDLLLSLDRMRILNDQGIIRSDRNNNSNLGESQMESIVGSFRKLEVD